MQGADDARDSGWRQIVASGSGAAAGSSFSVRRIGQRVIVNLQGITVKETSRQISNVASLPSGFRVAADYVFLVDRSPQSIGREILVNLFNGSTVYVREITGGAGEMNVTLDGIIEFTTFSEWPGTLPGSAMT